MPTPASSGPLLVLTGKGTPSTGSLRRFEALEPVANVTQLERPVHTRTLMSAVRSALRARRRQYDVRDHRVGRERLAETLGLAMDAAELGTWEWDPATDGMALSARAAAIYKDMGPATEMSGGSGANTIVGLASFGARAAFIGKVKNDQIGGLYTHDIRAAGAAFETRAAESGPATGCSYILVTPDGERTMNTYLGAAQDLTVADIEPAQIEASRIVYLEGYLWDPKSAKDAFVQAATIAHGAGRQLAL